MITVKTFPVNPLGTNCYVASDNDSKETVIIDCGCSAESEWNAIKQYIDSQQLKPTHLLCTHLHFDHVWGNAFVKQDFDLNPEASAEDLSLYYNAENMISDMFGMRMNLPQMPAVKNYLSNNNEIIIGSTTLKVIATPGHSRGGLCFYSAADNVLFAGDSLFNGSVGRTDLEGGNMQQLIESIRTKLITLPDNTIVYCGHGPYTFIGDEKLYNPFL